MKVSHLDVLIVSHGDNDHIGGAASLIASRTIDTILTSVPGQLSGSEPCIAGISWSFNQVMFEILGPGRFHARWKQ